MKKVLAIFITLALVFSTTPMIAIASELDGNNQEVSGETTNEVAQPQIPIITDDMPIDEANQLIDNYNNQVDEYNAYVAEENTRREEQYQQEVNTVDEHNAQEELKVEENNKQLAAQEKREQKIAAETPSKLENSSTETIPTSWTDETENPKLISVAQGTESDETYKVTNLHIYVNEEIGDTYIGTQINDNNFFVNLATANYMILSEWETLTVGKNDTVTVRSQAGLYAHSGAIFLRRFEGYTNGYWMPTQELMSTAKYVADSWDTNGPATEFSYENGTTDRQPIKNVLNIYVYNFIRYGDEPVTVEKYTPDIWSYPADVIYLNTINKIDRLIPAIAGGETPITNEDPEPTPAENPTAQPINQPVENPTTTPETPVDNPTPIVATITDAAPIAYVPTTQVNVQTATQTEPTPVVIEDDSTSLAGPRIIRTNSWALLNLIFTIITILLAIKIPREDDEEKDTEIKRRSNLIPILIAIGSVLVFIFTENVRLPMVLTDQYTIWMFLIMFLGGVGTFFTRDREVEEDE